MPALHVPLNLGLDLLILLVVTGVCLRPLKSAIADPMLRVLVACGLGLPLLSYGAFALGVAGALKFPTLVGGLILLGVFAIQPIYQLSQTRGHFSPASPFQTLEKIALMALISATVFNFLYNYAPPAGEDELVYHISLPVLYAQTGRFASTPAMFQSFFYLSGELIYAALLVLRDVFAVKAMVWLTGVLFITAFYFFARRYAGLNRATALVANLVVYTAPVITSLNGTTSVDMIHFFLEVLTVSLYWEWSQTPRTSLVIWMGVLGGAAVGYRNYAVIWVAAVFFMMLLFDRRLRDALLFGVVAACLFAPWPLRNYLITGNPFYPSAYWHGAVSDPLHIAMSPDVSLTSFFQTLIRLPFFVSAGTLIWDCGILPFALAPLPWILKDRSLPLKKLTFLAISILIMTHLIPWAWCGARYYAGAMPWLVLMGGRGLQSLFAGASRPWRVGVSLWIGALLLFPNWAFSAYFGLKRLPYFLGRQSEEAYIAAHYPGSEGYPMLHYLRTTLSNDQRVLTLGMIPRLPYYYYRDFSLLPMFEYPASFYERSTREFAEDLLKNNIGYVVIGNTEFQPLPDGRLKYTLYPKLDWWVPALSAPYFEEVFRSSLSTLYRVKSAR